MRYREKTGHEPFVVSPTVTRNIAVRHESISDVNNRKLRPNSPCKHQKVSWSPEPVPTVYGYRDYHTFHASSFLIYVEGLTAPIRADHYDRCIQKMQRLISKQIGGFSTLNFLFELRELPDLVDKIRFAPQNLRYIDYAFGIKPLLSDLRNALDSYNSQVSSFNDKMKKYRSIECNWTKTELIDQPQTYVGFGVGNRHKQSTTARLTTRMRGTVEMSIPLLAQVSPEVFSLLDDIMVDVSASNAWNALPWSWFADWFLPIGKYLEALPSGMKPLTWFNGTISHQITFFGETESVYEGPAWYFQSGWPAGKFSGSYYDRIAFSSEVSKMIRWKLSSINNPSQILLMRDIMLPARDKVNPFSFRGPIKNPKKFKRM